METDPPITPKAPLLQPQSSPTFMQQNSGNDSNVQGSKQDKSLSEFEQACEMAADETSPTKRHQGEEYLLRIKNSYQPYQFCMGVLFNSRESKAQHESALCIKDAFLREWKTLDVRMVIMMRTKILEYLCSNVSKLGEREEEQSIFFFFLINYQTMKKKEFKIKHIQGYVINQLIRLVAIMYKRIWFENERENARLMFTQVQKMLQNNKPPLVLVGLTFCREVIEEFSVNEASTPLGITLDFHMDCHRSFELYVLQSMFNMTCELFSKVMQSLVQPSSSSHPSALLAQDNIISMCAIVIENILSFQFHEKMDENTLLLRFDSNTKPKSDFSRPGLAWKDSLLKCPLVEMLAKAHNTLLYSKNVNLRLIAPRVRQAFSRMCLLQVFFFFKKKKKKKKNIVMFLYKLQLHR
ncbi:hypothetical protein RFI_27968 [Reticulomyxa filosa]|uniref:Exportin-4 n=1 Tax=Reticulomyxa filosa TaxID=46433 RepID=X6M605_RETFI|nr:hypothetical protein RFI_27968 [Reticulomyxa filosa]|eukprot:ETO09408.1 hypothetical protein RFI_27968 [Reticulomyxa filosa]